MADDLTKLNLDPQREKFSAQQRAKQNALDTDEDVIRLNLSQEREAYNMQLAAEQEEREPDSTQPQEKMSGLFFFAALTLSVIGDLIDFFTGGTIGWLVGLGIDALLAIMFGTSNSGRKQLKKMAIAILAETIPFIDVLPFRTIFTIWSFISSRSTVAQKLASKISKIV
jgi:hypothetical protein